MNRSLSLFLTCILLTGSIGVAWAGPIEHERQAPNIPGARDDFAEIEPNNSAATANVVDFLSYTAVVGSILPAGDEDWFLYTAHAGDCITFETYPGDPGGDTKLYLYAGDGVTQLEYDDDGGTGYYSQFSYQFDTSGPYYLVVTGYNSSTIIDQYFLTALYPLPTEELYGGETCNPGVCLEPADTRVISAGTTGYYNDYTPRLPDGTSCTSPYGYGATGPDVVYEVGLTDGATFWAELDVYCGASVDWSIYLVTDCGDMASCVAGSDVGNPENITFTHSGPTQLYYLIVDGYGGTSEGYYILTYGHDGVSCDHAIPTESRSWGAVKTLYR